MFLYSSFLALTVFVFFYYVFVLYFYIFSCVLLFFLFFFFKQKTAYELRISDWSSDVCSSDLQSFARVGQAFTEPIDPKASVGVEHDFDDGGIGEPGGDRRAERCAQHPRAARIRLRSDPLMLHDLSPARTPGRLAQRTGPRQEERKGGV